MSALKDRKAVFQVRESNGLENKTVVLDMGRRILAYEMATSNREIAPVAFNYEADLTRFLQEFQSLKQKHGIKITLNTILMRCVIEGMRAAPVLNSHLRYKYTSARGTLTMFDHVDVNMPTILPDGTMQALNIKNADKMTLTELDYCVKTLLGKLDDSLMFNKSQINLSFDQTVRQIARGKFITGFSRFFWAIFGKERILVKPYNTAIGYLAAQSKHAKTVNKNDVINKHDLEEGTVMITNIGSLYKDLKGNMTMLQIIPPQVFGVALGNIQKRPKVETDENGKDTIGVANIMPFNLVFDHRACDFGDIIPFIAKLDEIFENPQVMNDWI